ncbi:Ribonuclease T [Thioalkalivibrio nitratireducens DSM 14787]|uniref:Ribonuclease T n=1 Tax=Thioalkalivibrio nitratireducens (strain DSM 14787 / UNIQEM 213 / ALEN2) TaxID=1255043 RepID=L0DXJ3_THIND|nr:ribonuclease T [Thioalkalivibrio nitratireducens]AGA34309.1 Ribonuclease T [Thioalkalivibrio nitratireducens DSM 14787]
MTEAQTLPPDARPMANRFRGFLPVVVDVETGGFDCRRHALLQVAAVFLRRSPDNHLRRDRTLSLHVRPFEGALLDPKSLEVNGIDPFHPLRIAHPEDQALGRLFSEVRREVKINQCKRAILVGHNAHFDLGFVHTAAERCGIRRNPFHPFSSLDTVSLAALAYGQTVLAKAAEAAGFGWDSEAAHSAAYDAEMTADLFCTITNRWQDSAGIPEAAALPPTAPT